MSTFTPDPLRSLRHLVVLAAAALAAAWTPLASAAGTEETVVDGRSAEDVAVEAFLGEAVVVADEPLGSGVTGSRKLTLRHGAVDRFAVFKTVDIQSSEVTRTNRLEATFRDSYLFEVAAYRVDRLLGIGLVPVTVLREIDGRRGSLQIWVDDMVNFHEVVLHPELATGDGATLARRLTEMFVLDALISNVDRNWDNVLVDPDEDRFALIDHSRSFRMNTAVEPPAPGTVIVPLAPTLAERLRRLSGDELSRAVGDLLSRAQLRCLVKRQRSLVETLAAAHVLPADAV